MDDRQRAPQQALPADARRHLPRSEAVGSSAGQILMLQRAVGNRATTTLIQRQSDDDRDASRTTAVPSIPAAMSRAGFESMMAERYGISSVETGTIESQSRSLDRLAGRPREGATPPGRLLGQLVSAGTLAWSAWDPGPESNIYSSVAEGFAHLARALGGTPPIQRIEFYRIDYRTTSDSPGLEEDRATGATYSGHDLHVFSRAVSAVEGFPIERDEPGSPGRRPQLWATQHVTGVSVHELAHGIQEAALTPPTGSTTAPAVDPTLMTDYQQAVGWVGSRLYDIGDAALATELRAGRVPEGARRITAETWNSGDWHEQPVSAYSLQNSMEDFAEAVTAFVESPSSLRTRSPHRFEFLERRRSIIEHYLRSPSPPAASH